MALYQKILAMLSGMLVQLSEKSGEREAEESLMDAWREFVARALGLVPADKPYKTALFNALNRLQPVFAFEGVVLRENPETGELEVYLAQRAADDSAYPGEYHAPGSGVRNNETWEHVAARLGRSEYKVGISRIVPLWEAAFFNAEERGWYCSIPFLVELDAEPAVGKWYPVDRLPEQTVIHHREKIIPAAVSYWRNRVACDNARRAILAALRKEE